MSTYDILITNLTNGDNYVANDADGNPVTIQNPPNKYMLQAARALKQLLSIQSTDQILIQNLNQTNATLQEELNVLRTQTSIRPQDSSINSDPGGAL